jgi:pimeloyl-ACP methyl ester carboxylesterase
VGHVEQIAIGRAHLDVAQWGRAAPSIVFVHDGLGSIRQWHDVPERTAAASGRTVLAYDRSGHGRSTPVPTGAWPPNWMTHEADLLARLIEDRASGPVRLVGHSDGGSIALLCATRHPSLVSDVVAVAAHSWVEPKCVAAIAALRRDPASLVAALGNHHAHAPELFEAWSGGWTSAAFASWDIRPLLGAIAVPVAVAQGDADEFATDEMLWATVSAIGTHATALLLHGCRHAVHRDQPDVVVQLACGGR